MNANIFSKIDKIYDEMEQLASSMNRDEFIGFAIRKSKDVESGSVDAMLELILLTMIIEEIEKDNK